LIELPKARVIIDDKNAAHIGDLPRLASRPGNGRLLEISNISTGSVKPTEPIFVAASAGILYRSRQRIFANAAQSC
jgi:hypothetical protein